MIKWLVAPKVDDGLAVEGLWEQVDWRDLYGGEGAFLDKALEVARLFQPVGTVNYTTSEDYTRITEFKNMTGQVLPGKTTIMKEYSKAYTPGSGETPYYAILEPENRELYERYLERVQNLTNFHPVGRLAEYRYYDMDAVTNSALDLSDEIIACHA